MSYETMIDGKPYIFVDRNITNSDIPFLKQYLYPQKEQEQEQEPLPKDIDLVNTFVKRKYSNDESQTFKSQSIGIKQKTKDGKRYEFIWRVNYDSSSNSFSGCVTHIQPKTYDVENKNENNNNTDKNNNNKDNKILSNRTRFIECWLAFIILVLLLFILLHYYLRYYL